MDIYLLEALRFLVRWIHVIAVIFWAGRLVFFIALKETESESQSEQWITHGNGFYLLQKKRIGQGVGPPPAKRLKADIIITWFSGACLLALVYYANMSSFMSGPMEGHSPYAGIGASIAMIAVSWFIYNTIWNLFGESNKPMAYALSLLLVSGYAYVYCYILVGQAAFIHMGAMLGTWMIANARLHGLPTQQAMAKAAMAGGTAEDIDIKKRRTAWLRSMHNTYMAFPALFTMLSAHFSVGHSGPYNWIVLVGLVLLGLSICHALMRFDSKVRLVAVAIPMTVIVVAMLLPLVSWPAANSESQEEPAQKDTVSFNEVRTIIQRRCVSCHAADPEIPDFGPSPGSANFETDANINKLAERIHMRAVATKTMPPNNQTGMTNQERELLRKWLEEQAAK